MEAKDYKALLEDAEKELERLRTIEAWARIAFKAVKFAEAISPRGLHTLLTDAPDELKAD
jgi:ATP-dependent protease HslVU (ClpYQ) ATPase subunit